VFEERKLKKEARIFRGSQKRKLGGEDQGDIFGGSSTWGGNLRKRRGPGGTKRKYTKITCLAKKGVDDGATV